MSLPQKSKIFSRLIALCGLALVFTLAACSGMGTSADSTPASEPSPTPVPLHTYTGTGFTIGYPTTDWTPTNQNDSGITGVLISDSQQANLVDVYAIPVSDTGETADQVAADETTSLIQVVLDNPKPVTTVASTTTLAGATWKQQAFTGTLSNSQGQSGRFYMLTNVHNGQAYVILYGGSDDTFSTENTQYLQPMLQSFKFTS